MAIRMKRPIITFCNYYQFVGATFNMVFLKKWNEMYNQYFHSMTTRRDVEKMETKIYIEIV